MCVCLCNSMLCGNDWDLHLKEIYWCLSVDWVAVAFASFILMACLLWLGVLPVPLFDLISLSTPGIFSGLQVNNIAMVLDKLVFIIIV